MTKRTTHTPQPKTFRQIITLNLTNLPRCQETYPDYTIGEVEHFSTRCPEHLRGNLSSKFVLETLARDVSLEEATKVLQVLSESVKRFVQLTRPPSKENPALKEYHLGIQRTAGYSEITPRSYGHSLDTTLPEDVLAQFIIRKHRLSYEGSDFRCKVCYVDMADASLPWEYQRQTALDVSTEHSQFRRSFLSCTLLVPYNIPVTSHSSSSRETVQRLSLLRSWSGQAPTLFLFSPCNYQEDDPMQSIRNLQSSGLKSSLRTVLLTDLCRNEGAVS